ncbi:hypothetical protein FPV67DRAFT_1444733 [Lyophyllum atratum]|nr:hypothetical protein FPV67DRAFT_1444733 [Lyophyllum atratum]
MYSSNCNHWNLDMNVAKPLDQQQRSLHDRSETAYAHRFGDWNSMQYLCKFGKDGSSRSQTFYSGQTVAARMNAVREAITYVRNNWNDYPSLMADLRSYILELTSLSHESPGTPQHLPAVLSSYKVWNSRLNTVPNDVNLSVVRLYTSKAGYDQIFRIINQAFRTDDLTEQERRLRCAVFLIELLNIDLFNYTLRERQTHNFQGTVYRGVIFSEDQLQDFKRLATLPVSERYWAVPLAMMSASTNKEVALKEFAGTDATGVRRHSDTLSVPVANPHSHRASYPLYVPFPFANSPTSSARTRSCYEVLSFSSSVCGRRAFAGRETPIHVMELVMLNTNRDHPSTMQLPMEESEKARQLFACLVGMWRAEVCKQLATLYDLIDDVRQYERICNSEQAKFASLVC